MEDYITNGFMLNKALREHDAYLEDYMKYLFETWCKENKESVYSNSAMRRWKGLRYYD